MLAKTTKKMRALRDQIKKLKENQVDMQNNIQEERLQMEKTVDDMKKANEESQKKLIVLPPPSPIEFRSYESYHIRFFFALLVQMIAL
ncbi:hypothetical protein MKW94_028015 [Papaver nudicaule]|uniref:Uncharacterized protein n=1 Tax=Papaver nudicaule TaxID=74823 RepID=A0AA41SH53_PAPNU|nr:hypothetical protein [Papaver nudicaule]